MANKIRFGFLGFGRIAQADHIPALLKLKDQAEIRAVYDPAPGKAAARSKEFKISPMLPLAEREHVSRALCIHTGRELRCKVRTRGTGTRRRSRVRRDTVAGKSV